MILEMNISQFHVDNLNVQELSSEEINKPIFIICNNNNNLLTHPLKTFYLLIHFIFPIVFLI